MALLGGVFNGAWSTPSGGCGFAVGAAVDVCSEDCPLTSLSPEPSAFGITNMCVHVYSHKIVSKGSMSFHGHNR